MYRYNVRDITLFFGSFIDVNCIFSINVSKGSFSGSIPARNAIAIHAAAAGGKSAAVTFKKIGSMRYIGSIVVVIFLQSLLLVFY